ncbi:MAG TPA: zf-TFIIB domain-containing protein [Polyangiaceae bacterium]|nr:zf-TFIIB domain-containing protein [Polyangiaceae bacterium]
MPPEAPTFECAVCGAPAHGGDFSCRYCGAGIATVRCSRCFQMNMARAQHCSGCGAELGLIVESALHDRLCSDCQSPLELIVEPAGSLLNCRKCGGQFVEHALLRSLLENYEQTGQAFPDGPYQRPTKAQVERVRYRPCAVCQQPMNRKNFGGASGVIVDVCARHGTWFDPGELPQVLAFVKSGGLVRERAREQARQREARAHERDATRPSSPSLAFDSLAISGQSSFAKDLLEFILEVLAGPRPR